MLQDRGAKSSHFGERRRADGTQLAKRTGPRGRSYPRWNALICNAQTLIGLSAPWPEDIAGDFVETGGALMGGFGSGAPRRHAHTNERLCIDVDRVTRGIRRGDWLPGTVAWLSGSVVRYVLEPDSRW